MILQGIYTRWIIFLVVISTVVGLKSSQIKEYPYTKESSSNASSYAGVAVLGGVAAWAAYNMSNTVKEAVDSSCEKIQQSLTTKALRLVLKIEQIKDEGMSRSDKAKVGGLLGGCYLAKKCFSFFHLKELFEGDATKAHKAVCWCQKESPKILIGTGAAVLFGYGLWRLTDKAHIFDRLRLTGEQREKCSCSKELSYLEREEKFRKLLMHEAFTKLLTEKQRIIQQVLIKEYEDNDSWDELDDL